MYGSEDSEYQKSYKLRKQQQEYIAKNKGEWTKPIPGPWIHGAVLKFLENDKNGENPTGHPTLNETDGFVGSIPLIALHAGKLLKQG